MDAQVKTRLATKVVEATIREMSGHFRKGRELKRALPCGTERRVEGVRRGPRG